MTEITVQSLFRDDLQRFKLASAGATLAGIRAALVSHHRGVLPENFVIKYEWGERASPPAPPAPPTWPAYPAQVLRRAGLAERLG